jgi:GT2 family glycosyltransferase
MATLEPLVPAPEQPFLSIVVVNSDGAEDTLACLRSIYQHPPQVNFEVICVDNCSSSPFLPVLSQAFPEVRGVRAPQRQGFARNYNLGIRLAKGDFVLILNNDTLVHVDALDILLEVFRQYEQCGMVGPRLVSANGQTQTVCARKLLTPLDYILIQFLFDLALPAGKWLDGLRRRQLEQRGSGPVPCIIGACMLTSRAVLEQIGLLDEGYDFYYEDVEWCRRARMFGLQVVYVAEARITHLGDQSLAKVKEWAKQSEYKSAILYFRQYHRLKL